MMHGRIEVAVWANEAVEQLDLAALGIADRCCLYQTAACLEINEGRAERARDLVGRAEELSLELAPDELPTDLVGGSSVCFFLGLLDQGDAIAERLATRLSTIGPSVALAVTIISRSAIHGYRNRPEAALEFAQTALTMLADDDVPTWRTLAEWQVDRYSDLEPLELSERVRGHRDRFLQVRNAFLAATATRQLIGLESARATAQSQAMAGAIEAMGKLSMADPREAIGWMMQAAILLLHAGHYRAGAHHPRMGGAESRHAGAPRSARGDRAADARSARRAGRHDDRRSDSRDEFRNTARRDRLHRAALVDAFGQNSGD